jgi:hypothetical protein
MPFSQIFVWVEGPDDQRFVETILLPAMRGQYDFVEIVPYAGMTKEKAIKWLESIRAMENTNYIFLADKDRSPCVSQKKADLTQKIKSLQADRISVVVEEIEAWYLAGLTAHGRASLEIAYIGNTDHIDKEAFDLHRAEAFDSRVDWMIEMLRFYSLEEGTARNASLRYFAEKFLLGTAQH